MERVKVLLSLGLGLVATFCKAYSFIFGLLITVILFDWLTGILDDKINGKGWNSKTATIGFWKKIALLVALAFGVFLDWFIAYALQHINITLPTSTPFSIVIGLYIIFNETISICENLYGCSPNLLPKWIINILQVAKDKINNGGDENE